MSEQKVPLPEPDAVTCGDQKYHTTASIQSYGDAREQAGWNAAIEWAAKKCDNLPPYATKYECAAAIRKGRK